MMYKQRLCGYIIMSDVHEPLSMINSASGSSDSVGGITKRHVRSTNSRVALYVFAKSRKSKKQPNCLSRKAPSKGLSRKLRRIIHKELFIRRTPSKPCKKLLRTTLSKSSRMQTNKQPMATERRLRLVTFRCQSRKCQFMM